MREEKKENIFTASEHSYSEWASQTKKISWACSSDISVEITDQIRIIVRTANHVRTINLVKTTCQVRTTQWLSKWASLEIVFI